MSSVYRKGKVKFYNSNRGFGFIRENGSKREYFFTMSGFREPFPNHWGTNNFTLPKEKATTINEGEKIVIIDYSEEERGPVALQWTLQSLLLPPPVLYFVIRTKQSITEGCDKARRLWTRQVLTSEEVVYIGTYKDCHTYAQEVKNCRVVAISMESQGKVEEETPSEITERISNEN